MDAKTVKLHDIMREYKFKASDVAEILGKESNTVRVWRCKSSNRVIPDDQLELLEQQAPGFADVRAQRRADKSAEKARAAELAKWSQYGAKGGK